MFNKHSGNLPKLQTFKTLESIQARTNKIELVIVN